MFKEQELSNAIDAYLDKSIMPLPEGHPMRPDRPSPSWGDIKQTIRQAGEAIGVVKKPKVPPIKNQAMDHSKTYDPGSEEWNKLEGWERGMAKPEDWEVKPKPIKKSMDLEESSRSWSYQG
jgi:hypothetical protein